MTTPAPRGFRVSTAALGIKDDRDDAMVVHSARPTSSAAVFTRSRFAGPSVVISREALAHRDTRAVLVLARNANVATGAQGMSDALEVRSLAAGRCAVSPDEVLVASTGVIGRHYPMERVRAGFERLTLTEREAGADDFAAAAAAMMTTDTHPKTAWARCGDAVVTGIAKGVGMIEPDMATLLTFLFTDAAVDRDVLRRVFVDAVDTTFNAVSIDTDTSTSDTAAILANGAAGAVDDDELARAVHEVCLDLTRQVARDGEGATKLLTVRCHGARDVDQARRVAKSVVNSPLVKTAVHGADPNWGRVVMAVGKCSDDTDIDPDRVSVSFGDQQVFPDEAGEAGLRRLQDYLRGDEVEIRVGLGSGDAAFAVYGCDLSADYVRINADYTT